MRVVPCRSCGRKIWLVRDGHTGNTRPIDPVAQLNGPGNIVLVGHGEQQTCIQLTKTDQADGRSRYTHFPHQATCTGRRANAA